jgi:DNA polymerase I
MAELVLQYRKYSKVLNTWLIPFRARALDGDTQQHGQYRIHTNWHHTSTATGRLASTDPNLQNLPKQPLVVVPPNAESAHVIASVTISIRGAFHAKPGHSFVALDYSQVCTMLQHCLATHAWYD